VGFQTIDVQADKGTLRLKNTLEFGAECSIVNARMNRV
jgi:hypothetical protein